MRRPFAVLLPVLLFLALALPITVHWSPPGDEGGTFNQAMARARVSGDPAARTPFASLGPLLNNEVDTDVGDVVEAMRQRGMHPPAYYVAVHGWTRAFGTSPPALRLPGLVLGVLSVLGLWAIAREIVPEGSTATWAACLLAASANHLYFSLYLRPYSLTLTLAIASLWLLLRLRAETSPRREAACWAAFVAVNLAGLYTLYHYAFFLVWQFTVLGLQALLAPKVSRAADLARPLVAGLVIVAGFAPWLGSLAHHMEITATRRFYFQGLPESGAWLANATNLVRKLTIRGEFPELGVLWPLAGLSLVTAGLIARPLLGAGPEARRPDLRIFWLSLPLLPAGILLADVVRETHTIFLIKTMLLTLPLAIVALAVGARALEPRALGTGVLALWLAIFLAGSSSLAVATVTTPVWQARVARELASQDEPGHVVVVSSQARRFLHPLLMELRDEGVGDLELVYAGRREIAGVLPQLLRDPTVTRLTLVSFGDDEGWDEPVRQRALIQSRMLGWQRIRQGIPSLVSLERMETRP